MSQIGSCVTSCEGVHGDRPGAGRGRVSYAIACLILGTLIALVYQPSLGHAPRGDQWAYFLETMGHDGFLDILGQTYSYNRMTRIFSGDTPLFRPVFFVVLAFQKAFFGTRFWLCQATGIVLHVAACC